MTETVKFQPVSQDSRNGTITINISSSPSNRSYSTLKRVGGGLLTLAGIVTLTATIYFSVIKAPKETASSSNATSSLPGVFSDNTEPSVNQSSLSLYNIFQLVETEPDYYDNCLPAFETHWNLFKTCGVSVCNCMRNAGEVFKLFCNTDECQEASRAMEACRERSC